MRIRNTPWLRFAGVAIFFYLLFFQVGIVELGQRLALMNLWLVLLVFPLNWLQWGVRALRWRILLRNEEIHLPLRDVYVLGCAGILLGCWTPGRVGEFIKVKFLMNGGHSLRGSFLSSFIERVLDLGTLMWFVGFGLAVCFRLLPQQLFTYTVAFVLIGIGVVALVVFRRVIQQKFLGMLPDTLAENVNDKINLFKQSLRRITRLQWCWLLIYSIGVWGLNYLMIYVLYLASGNTMAFYYAFAFAAIGSFAGLIPLSIFGAGIREPVFIVLFDLLGYPSEQAVREGLLFGMMFLILLLIHIITGLICWISPMMKPYLQKQ